MANPISRMFGTGPRSLAANLGRAGRYARTAIVRQMARHGLPVRGTARVLRDQTNGLTCYQTPVCRLDAAMAGRIKDYVMAGAARQHYEGFSLEIDNVFDPFSDYIYVEGIGNRLIAALRLTRKTTGSRLPLELGLRDDGRRYRLAEKGGVADVNSFVFSTARALPLLFSATARYASACGIAKAFCLVDEASQRMEQIYSAAGFEPSQSYPEKIYFPTFGRSEGGAFKPTYWSIMEIGPDRILEHSRAADKYQKVSG